VNIPTKKPNSKDVARLARVSQATVSYVLNGKTEGYVSEDNRKRVLDAMRELGYRPNDLAKALLQGRTNTVGAFTCFIGSRFHAEILRGAQEALWEHGYSLLLAISEIDHLATSAHIETLMNHRSDGLLVIGGFQSTSGTPPWLDTVLATKTPCVVVDDVSCAGKLDCVASDDADGIRQAVAHLAATGHSRIAYVPGAWSSTTAEERRAAFATSVDALGLDRAREWFPPIPANPDEEFALFHRMISLAPRPTALVFASDHSASHFIGEAAKRGVHIPGDIAITGYGNEEIGTFRRITTVDQCPRRMGRSAAMRLVERLNGHDLAPETLRTPTSLTVRDTTPPGK
jgi:DNA-binding LacI/PurR family transcriptional regulator